MTKPALLDYQNELARIEAEGLLKRERIITSAQSAEIQLADGRRVLNFCANNYLGLADNPDIIQAAKDALDSHGFGMASVRFICGTQGVHKELEARLSEFLGTEDAIRPGSEECMSLLEPLVIHEIFVVFPTACLAFYLLWFSQLHAWRFIW